MTGRPALSAEDVPPAAARTVARQARDKNDLLDLLAALDLPSDEDTVTALLPLLTEAQPETLCLPAPQLSLRSPHQPHSKENQPVNAYNAVALSMNSDGFSDQQIADQLGTGRDEITQIIDAAKAGKTSVPQAPADPAGQAQSPATDPVPEVAELLAWAAGHEDQAVRTHGTQASAALTALRERRQADTELELITTEAARLEKRLADLRARESELRPATKKKQRDHDPREVRTWAREHQVPVPARGKIPDDVLAAWRQRSDGQTLALAS